MRKVEGQTGKESFLGGRKSRKRQENKCCCSGERTKLSWSRWGLPHRASGVKAGCGSQPFLYPGRPGTGQPAGDARQEAADPGEVTRINKAFLFSLFLVQVIEAPGHFETVKKTLFCLFLRGIVVLWLPVPPFCPEAWLLLR